MCDGLDYDAGGDDIIDRADHVYVLHDDGWHTIDYFNGDEHAIDDDDSFALDDLGWDALGPLGAAWRDDDVEL